MSTTVNRSDTEPLRILHVLDHSIPLHSGYTFRTRSILQQQRALGLSLIHISEPTRPY